MKSLLTLLILIVSLQTFGQRKGKTDPKDAQIDTLTRTNKALVLKTDSLSAELVKFVGVYDVIREKVIHYNFDPTRMSYLIDSLRTSRDSLASLVSVTKIPDASADSLIKLVKENKSLKVELDSVRTAWENNQAAIPREEIEKAKAIGNLKQLKELLDAKIITEAEYISVKKKYLNML